MCLSALMNKSHVSIQNTQMAVWSERDLDFDRSTICIPQGHRGTITRELQSNLHGCFRLSAC